MADPVESLVLDCLEWIAREPRAYADVIEVWRTSCPRLPVWEEVNDRGFVARSHRPGQEAQVSITAAGRAWLRTHRAIGDPSTLDTAPTAR